MTREDILSIAKPILFNTDMVRAILDDRKTVTRRKVEFLKGKNPNWTGYVKDGLMLYNGTNETCIKPSTYKVGDYLYVRETWNTNPLSIYEYGNEPNRYVYKADYDGHGGDFGWKPSIHMPKEAARIFLRVTNVGVERLQDMETSNDEHYHAEGAKDKHDFIRIWGSTMKPAEREKYGWYANPWVWVIEFERIYLEAN